MTMNTNKQNQEKSGQNESGNKRTVKDVAIEFDDRLKYLALYAHTKGLMQKITSTDELMNKFAEFKGLLNRGTFIIDELEHDIFIRYGAFDDKMKAELLTPSNLIGVDYE